MFISTTIIGLLLGAALAVIYVAYLTYQYVKNWISETIKEYNRRKLKGIIAKSKSTNNEIYLGIIDESDGEVMEAQRIKYDNLDSELRSKISGKEYVTVNTY